jgi:hypothetical protein
MIDHWTSLRALKSGDWWIDEEASFQSAVGLDESFDRVFLGHFGQVKFSANNQGICISWDVRKAAREAVSAAAQRLFECGTKSAVHLNYFY